MSQNLGPLDERGAAQLDIMVKVSLFSLCYRIHVPVRVALKVLHNRKRQPEMLNYVSLLKLSIPVGDLIVHISMGVYQVKSTRA